MYKALLSDIKKKLFIRSALIALDSLEEILGLNNSLSCDEILLEIFKKTLREFELYEPLVLDMPVNFGQLMCSCGAPPGYGEIKSNFTLYLECALPESRIILVPNSLPSWRVGDLPYGGGCCLNGYYSTASIPQPGAYQDFTDYRKPYVYVGDIGIWWGTGEIIIRGICSRPIIPDFLPDKSFNSDSGKAAIYFLDIESGAQGNYFMDLCLAYTLDYIRQLKASVTLPNMPIDVFGNVDSAYQELRQRCDQYALQSGWRGELLMI